VNEQTVLEILKSELAPAMGCTEPVAIAYAAARAKDALGAMPEKAYVRVSRNILKNAMGVGIPKTDAVGLEMAAAMGIVGGKSEAILQVLDGITPDQTEEARRFAQTGIEVSLADTPKKLYIEVELHAADDSSLVIIEDSHTHITTIMHGRQLLFSQGNCVEEVTSSGTEESGLTVQDIWDFVNTVPVERLSLLDETIRLNWDIAQEGLQGEYGLNVGRTLMPDIGMLDVTNYATAIACAAADARMSGCAKSVMTICGSGNQGITATLPVIAAAKAYGISGELFYRSLALSCLITIHIKRYIGKLSPLCGCGVGSSIGVCCALTYMKGGNLTQIEIAINNMIADISGIICDGAKSGCALKIATVIASAFKCSKLALRNMGAGELDGIVTDNVETTIRNLGQLGNAGMSNTDRVILDMMVK